MSAPLSTRAELGAYLDQLHITSDNIGDIRRGLFTPDDSDWNSWVRDDTAARENGSLGRLNLADVEERCCFTVDDLFLITLETVQRQDDLAGRLSRLLAGDAGRTINEMGKILGVVNVDVIYALAYLSQAGALLQVLDVAGPHKGYKLVGWV